MKIQTKIQREPDNRTTNLWDDHGIEDCIRIKCRGSVRLPGGTKIAIESREHRGIPKSMPERIDAAYRRLQKTVLDDLRFVAKDPAVLELNDQTTEPDDDLDAVRTTLVIQSHGQTAEVFAYIDRLDAKSRTSGIVWTKHPGLGIRGSVTETPPRICREARGASFKIDKAEWDSDGELDCLCVLGMGHEINETAKESDLETSTVHHQPMAEARRLAANAENEDDAPKKFTMDTAPWGRAGPGAGRRRVGPRRPEGVDQRLPPGSDRRGDRTADDDLLGRSNAVTSAAGRGGPRANPGSR